MDSLIPSPRTTSSQILFLFLLSQAQQSKQLINQLAYLITFGILRSRIPHYLFSLLQKHFITRTTTTSQTNTKSETNAQVLLTTPPLLLQQKTKQQYALLHNSPPQSMMRLILSPPQSPASSPLLSPPSKLSLLKHLKSPKYSHRFNNTTNIEKSSELSSTLLPAAAAAIANQVHDSLSHICFSIAAKTLETLTSLLASTLKQKYQSDLDSHFPALSCAVNVASNILDEFFEYLSIVGLKNLKQLIEERISIEKYFTLNSFSDDDNNQQSADNICEIFAMIKGDFAKSLLKSSHSSTLSRPNDHYKLSNTKAGATKSSKRNNAAAASRGYDSIYLQKLKKANKSSGNNAIFAHLLDVSAPENVILDAIFMFVADIDRNKIVRDTKFIVKQIEAADAKCRERKYQPSLQSIPEIADDERGYESDQSSSPEDFDDFRASNIRQNKKTGSLIFSQRRQQQLKKKKQSQIQQTSYRSPQSSSKQGQQQQFYGGEIAKKLFAIRPRTHTDIPSAAEACDSEEQQVDMIESEFIAIPRSLSEEQLENNATNDTDTIMSNSFGIQLFQPNLAKKVIKQRNPSDSFTGRRSEDRQYLSQIYDQEYSEEVAGERTRRNQQTCSQQEEEEEEIKSKKIFWSESEFKNENAFQYSASDVAENRNRLAKFVQSICMEAIDFLESKSFQTLFYFELLAEFNKIQNRTREMLYQESPQTFQRTSVNQVLSSFKAAIKCYSLDDEAIERMSRIYEDALEEQQPHRETNHSNCIEKLIQRANILEEVEQQTVLNQSKKEFVSIILQNK